MVYSALSQEEHTTTDDPAVDCVKGSEKGGDSSLSKPPSISGSPEPMDTDNNTTETNDSESLQIKEEKPSSSKSTTLCPSSSPSASSSVDTKQDKDIKSQDIKEEEDEIEDAKKESTEGEKMEVESVKVEPKKEKTDASQTTKPSRPSSTPPFSSGMTQGSVEIRKNSGTPDVIDEMTQPVLSSVRSHGDRV